VRPALLVEEDVGRLDVAVDDARPMGGREGAEEVVGQALDLVRWEGPEAAHPVGEAAALHPGHHQDHVVTVVDHVEQPDDAPVVELAQHLGLSPDPGAGTGQGLGGAAERQTLQGHAGAVGPHGEVHDAHAATTQAALDDVAGSHVTDDRTGGRRTGAVVTHVTSVL
jgi:hypothetical protein